MRLILARDVAALSLRRQERLRRRGNPRPDNMALMIASRRATMRLLTGHPRRAMAIPPLERLGVNLNRLIQRYIHRTAPVVKLSCLIHPRPTSFKNQPNLCTFGLAAYTSYKNCGNLPPNLNVGGISWRRGCAFVRTERFSWSTAHAKSPSQKRSTRRTAIVRRLKSCRGSRCRSETAVA